MDRMQNHGNVPPLRWDRSMLDSDKPASSTSSCSSSQSAACRRVGVLGGGQLAMFLCAEARALGLATTVLAHSDDSPAQFTADETLKGRLDDLQLIDRLLERCDVVTFDVEEIPPATLEHLALRAREPGVDVQPEPRTMLILQDKLKQKEWLVRHGLPTPPFKALDDSVGHDEIAGCFGMPFVQKTRRGGYDGRGVQVLKHADDLARLWDGTTLIEPFLDGIRELSVVAARSNSGEVACYEVAELTFDAQLNVLDMVIVPARITAELREEALGIARRTLEQLGGAGVFTLELFLTADGQLLINEISPRVHNTGHHTLESCDTSQFSQHLRAICGMPLGSTRLNQPAAMRNLLWQDDLAQGRWGQRNRRIAVAEGTFVHWYGKRAPRPWRKMGHITAVGDSSEQAVRRAQTPIQEITRAWNRS